MREPKTPTSAIHPGDLRTDLTEEAIRAWLETFHASGEVDKVDIARRLASRVAFWKD